MRVVSAPVSGSDVFIIRFFLISYRSLLDSLVDPLEARLSPENFQGFEQRRSGLAAANRYANGQEHLPGFDFQARRLRRAMRLREPACVKSALERTSRACSSTRAAIAASPFCGISSAGSYGAQFVDEEEVSHSRDVGQDADSLPDQRRHLQHLGFIGLPARRLNIRQQMRREFFDRHRVNVLRVQPQRLRIDRIFLA